MPQHIPSLTVSRLWLFKQDHSGTLLPCTTVSSARTVSLFRLLMSCFVGGGFSRRRSMALRNRPSLLCLSVSDTERGSLLFLPRYLSFSLFFLSVSYLALRDGVRFSLTRTPVFPHLYASFTSQTNRINGTHTLCFDSSLLSHCHAQLSCASSTASEAWSLLFVSVSVHEIESVES